MSLSHAALAFFFVGSGVKYIDAAYDDELFTKSHTILLSLALGGLVGLLMISNHDLLLVSLSLLIGVASTGKLDILPFRLLSIFCLLIVLVFVRLSPSLGGPDWGMISLLAVAAAIDEIGNDTADSKVLTGWLRLFFLNRGFLKLSAILLLTLHYISTTLILALFSFDLGYFMVTYLASKLTGPGIGHRES